MAAVDLEKRYRAALKQWESYQTWKTRRNPTRAKLELAHGYDTKHAMHLIRLMRMGLEILARGELLVRRNDAAELIAIRDGAHSYEELLSTAAQLTDAMANAMATTTLPDDVDRASIDALTFRLMAEIPR